MARYYFTYGSEGHPFSGGWTEVEAESFEEARTAFRVYHPDKTEGFLNCCSVYTEEEILRSKMFVVGNLGHFCHETIVILRTLHDGGE